MPQERLLRAISIRQPLIELILTGEKDVEYRSRRTLIRERVYLYAPKTLLAVEGFPETLARELPRALIVGSIEITDCFHDDDEGCWGWELARPRRYRTPLAPRGQPQPGFWRPRF